MTISRHDKRGFTLLEMIVVLVVLGLMLGLVMAHRPARGDGLELDASARHVRGALRLARSRAIAEEHAVTVMFEARGYCLNTDVPIEWSANVSAAGDRAISFTLMAGHRTDASSCEVGTGRSQSASIGSRDAS
jgi:prepilin-type N-terminal cleavage/methylation domain-containing protein